MGVYPAHPPPLPPGLRFRSINRYGRLVLWTLFLRRFLVVTSVSDPGSACANPLPPPPWEVDIACLMTMTTLSLESRDHKWISCPMLAPSIPIHVRSLCQPYVYSHPCIPFPPPHSQPNLIWLTPTDLVIGHGTYLPSQGMGAGLMNHRWSCQQGDLGER